MRGSRMPARSALGYVKRNINVVEERDLDPATDGASPDDS